MTSEDRDPALQALFAETQRELDGEAFTARIMAQTRFLKYRTIAPWVAAVVVLALGTVLFAVPLQDLTQIVARALTTSLIDLGEGWVAWVASPINNVASIVVLSLKALRMLRKKILNASYAS